MPKKAVELKALEVSRLTTPGFHAVGGTAGLHLRVSPSGARSWILRATVGDRRRDLGLGGFPDVTLAIARDKARHARLGIERGIDPFSARRDAKASFSSTLTFDEAYRRLIDAKAPEWKNEKHLAQWHSTLKTYASPRIGKIPVDEIELSHVMDVLSPLWTSKTETASRVRSRIEAVLAWATASGYRSGDNPARWKGNLDALLAKPGKVRRVVHHSAMDIDSLPAFVQSLSGRTGAAARALEFLILTATRSGEVRNATWGEFDLLAGTWTIPASRMKAGREHRVPLSPSALSVLNALPKLAGSDAVFPGPSGRPLSDMALSALMTRMAVDAVPHGFRSTFRDWASEKSTFPRDVAEMALAHSIGNKVEAAYRRGDLFEKRRKMMNAWAAFAMSHRNSVTSRLEVAK